MGNYYKSKPRIPTSIENAQDLDEAIIVAFSKVLTINGIPQTTEFIDLDKLRQIKTELSRYIYTMFCGKTKVVADPPTILPSYVWEELNE